MVDQQTLDRLTACAMPAESEQIPLEVEYGWSGGRHVLDDTFSFEHNRYDDALLFALRVDTNRVPSELKQAYKMIEEGKITSDGPVAPKLQKQQAKRVVEQRLEDELRSGRYRRSKLFPVLWDLPTQMLYCTASGKAQEQLIELVQRTLGLDLTPLTSGLLAQSRLDAKGRRRDYEELQPTRFAPAIDGEGREVEYPWMARMAAPKDFLGNEMLLWLWHLAEGRDGCVSTSLGEITIMFEKSLQLECVYGVGGKDALRADAPCQLPEARDALRIGKAPRRAGLTMVAQGSQYAFTWSAEDLGVSGLSLPPVEDAENPRVLLEERISMLRDFSKALDAIYDAFLHLRVGGAWNETSKQLQTWIANGAGSHSDAPVAVVSRVEPTDLEANADIEANADVAANVDVEADSEGDPQAETSAEEVTEAA